MSGEWAENDSRVIAFEIEATAEKLLGSVREMTFGIVVQTAGQEIRQRTGRGELRIVPHRDSQE